jgi:hypothetical protein
MNKKAVGGCYTLNSFVNEYEITILQALQAIVFMNPVSGYPSPPAGYLLVAPRRVVALPFCAGCRRAMAFSGRAARGDRRMIAALP